jgi:hypothetical protein
MAGLSCFTCLKIVYYYMDAHEYFKTKEFKSLSPLRKLWLRFQVAFFETIQML